MMLDLIKGFFCIYWDDQVVFVFASVNCGLLRLLIFVCWTTPASLRWSLLGKPTCFATISHCDSKVYYLSPITHAFTCSILGYMHSDCQHVPVRNNLINWSMALYKALCFFTITICSHLHHCLIMYYIFAQSLQRGYELPF
jgi:hypothetical protein